MMRTLFLNPPSFSGLDGGAGARYQAWRELGRAHACVPTAGGVTASVLALRDQGIRPAAGPASRWEPAYMAALQRIGL